MSYKKKRPRGKYNVVVYNDDHNDYDHVVTSIFEVCGHNLIQAEQCVHLIHHVGKCNVFHGTYSLCSEIYEELLKDGLTVKLLK